MRNQNNTNLPMTAKDSSVKGLLLVIEIENDSEFTNQDTIYRLMSISIVSLLIKWKRNNEIEGVYRRNHQLITEDFQDLDAWATNPRVIF